MLKEDDYTTKTINGKKQFYVKGEAGKDDLFEIRIIDALSEKFTPNMTRTMEFEDKILNLGEEDIIAKEAQVTIGSYKSLKALNHTSEQLQSDITKTNANKLLLKTEMSDKHFDTFNSLSSRLDLNIRKELENESKELFSSNLMLNVQEDTLLGQYAAAFKDKDINFLIDGTPGEARIALTLVRDFPSLVKFYGDYEDLAHSANHIFTEQHAIRFDNLINLREEVRNLSKTVAHDRSKFLSPDLVDEVRSVRVTTPKRGRR